MKECRDCCDVQSCFLCRLSLDDWRLAIKSHKKNFSIKKGHSIFKEGDPVTGIYFVYSGTIKAHKRWDNEKELIIRFSKAGDVLGHLGLGAEPRYPVSATAVEPSVVCYIDLSFFESSLKVNAALTYKLMQVFADELHDSRKSMLNFVHMSVKARIAQAFIALKSQFGTADDGYIKVELSRQDLSSFSGTSYETLFKVINEFTQDGLVEFSGRKIKLLDEAMLSKVISGDSL
ncbi:MAG: cAMP-binding protein [Sphingobacteriaceae bacterium]|jgi:CRP/FNR family transcriptional regulator|nr:cAMP-binding protein [Sphingobacteriaceae bacterium]